METKSKITLFLTTPNSMSRRTYLNGIFKLGLCAFYDKNVALSQGEDKIVKTIEIEEKRIVSNYDLNYVIDPDIVKSVYNDFNFDEKDFDFINECVLKEKIFFMDEDEVKRIFKTYICPDLLYKMMEIRGAIARNAGYDAIEMYDEGGVCYIVVNVFETLRENGFSTKYSVRLSRHGKSDLLITGFSTMLEVVNFSKKFIDDPDFKGYKIEKN